MPHLTCLTLQHGACLHCGSKSHFSSHHLKILILPEDMWISIIPQGFSFQIIIWTSSVETQVYLSYSVSSTKISLEDGPGKLIHHAMGQGTFLALAQTRQT